MDPRKVNPYQYAGGNPIGYIDPTGLDDDWYSGWAPYEGEFSWSEIASMEVELQGRMLEIIEHTGEHVEDSVKEAHRQVILTSKRYLRRRQRVEEEERERSRREAQARAAKCMRTRTRGIQRAGDQARDLQDRNAEEKRRKQEEARRKFLNAQYGELGESIFGLGGNMPGTGRPWMDSTGMGAAGAHGVAPGQSGGGGGGDPWVAVWDLSNVPQ